MQTEGTNVFFCVSSNDPHILVCLSWLQQLDFNIDLVNFSISNFGSQLVSKRLNYDRLMMKTVVVVEDEEGSGVLVRILLHLAPKHFKTRTNMRRARFAKVLQVGRCKKYLQRCIQCSLHCSSCISLNVNT